MAMMNKPALDQAFKRAAAAHKAVNLAEAKAGFERIIKAVPNMAQARFQLARILLEADDAKGAVIHLEAARKSAPKQPPVWQLSAIALGVLGDTARIDKFNAELRAAPIPATVKSDIAAKMKSDRPAEFGGAPKAEMDALIAALVRRDGDQAFDIAQRLDTAHPGNALILNALATAYELKGDATAADVIFRKAIRTDPYAATVRTNYARYLSEREQFLPASQHLERATQLQPDNPKLLIMWAVALCEIKQARQAEEAAHKAIELSGGDPEAKLALARAQSLNQKPDAAVALFNELVAANACMPRALIQRANHYQHSGDFEASNTDYLAALAQKPDMTELFYQIAVGRKFAADDPVIPILEDRAKAASPDEIDVNIAFALSKICEDTKQYDRVFTYLNAANATLDEAWNPDRYGNFENHVHEIAQKVDLQKVAANSPNRANPILVTGLPRSGTTLTEQILAAHSTMTGVGEALWSRAALHPVMASKAAADWTENDLTAALNTLGSEYERMARQDFPNAGRMVDKALGNHEQIGLLRAAMPDARIVVLKRDPRDNLLSIYKNRFAEGSLKYNTDMRALAHYYSRFLKWLDYWQDLWPDSFHVLDYDKLTADPEGEARKMLAYCDLPWEDGVLDFHKSDNSVRTLSVYQVRQPIYRSSVRSWERYADDLKTLLDALVEFGVPLPD